MYCMCDILPVVCALIRGQINHIEKNGREATTNQHMVCGSNFWW